MEVRTTVNEVIARRICTVALCLAVSYVSYHIGKFMMKKEIKRNEKKQAKSI